MEEKLGQAHIERTVFLLTLAGLTSAVAWLREKSWLGANKTRASARTQSFPRTTLVSYVHLVLVPPPHIATKTAYIQYRYYRYLSSSSSSSS